MGATTKIEWCDHSASPWYGCSEVHAGCDHCYARELSKRNPLTLGSWGPDGVRVKSKSFVRNLRLWQKQAAEAGRIETVFPSLCDPFEDRPELEPWRREMFEVIDQCPNLRLLLLTKRPENVRRMWPQPINPHNYGSPAQVIRSGMLRRYRYETGVSDKSIMDVVRPNVWILTSVSDQPTADKMIHELLKLRDLVPVLGLSAEPLLGPVDLDRLWPGGMPSPGKGPYVSGIDWVIVGGESGPHARPMHPDWARDIRDQCQAAGVPFFFKQHGEWCAFRDLPDETIASVEIDMLPMRDMANHSVHRVGKKAAGRLLDGREWSEFPNTETR